MMYFFVAANVAILIVGLVSIWLMRSDRGDESLSATGHADMSVASSQASATRPQPRLRAVDEHDQVVLRATYVDGEQLDSLFAFDSHLGGSDTAVSESAAGES